MNTDIRKNSAGIILTATAWVSAAGLTSFLMFELLLAARSPKGSMFFLSAFYFLAIASAPLVLLAIIVSVLRHTRKEPTANGFGRFGLWIGTAFLALIVWVITAVDRHPVVQPNHLIDRPAAR